MFQVVLYHPKIPPNTGNIIRLCANIGAKLHLIEPLGFEMEDKRLRRAGLDYREFASVMTHTSLRAFLEQVKPPRLFACSKYASHSYHEARFQGGDAILFGSETKGLPDKIRESLPDTHLLRIPMRPKNRSLNTSRMPFRSSSLKLGGRMDSWVKISKSARKRKGRARGEAKNKSLQKTGGS